MPTWGIQNDSEVESEKSSVSSFALDTSRLNFLAVDKRPFPRMMMLSGLIEPMASVCEESLDGATQHTTYTRSESECWSYLSGEDEIQVNAGCVCNLRPEDSASQQIVWHSSSQTPSINPTLASIHETANIVASQDGSTSMDELSEKQSDHFICTKPNLNSNHVDLLVATTAAQLTATTTQNEIASNQATAQRDRNTKTQSKLFASMSFRPSLERGKRSSPLSKELVSPANAELFPSRPYNHNSPNYSAVSPKQPRNLDSDLSLNMQKRSKTTSKLSLIPNTFRSMSLNQMDRSKSAIFASRNSPAPSGMPDTTPSPPDRPRTLASSTMISNREHDEIAGDCRASKPSNGIKRFFQNARSFFQPKYSSSCSAEKCEGDRPKKRFTFPMGQRHKSKRQNNSSACTANNNSEPSIESQPTSSGNSIDNHHYKKHSQILVADEDATLHHTPATVYSDFEPRPETLASLDRSRAQWKVIGVKSLPAAVTAPATSTQYSEAIKRSEFVLQELRTLQPLPETCNDDLSELDATLGDHLLVSQELAKLYYDVCVSGLGVDEIACRANDGEYV